jgi:phosphoglucomutase
MGMDTHALPEPAHAGALEVFAAAGVSVMVQSGLRYTPTPLEEKFGCSVYERMDAPANGQQKDILKRLSPDMIVAKELAGEPIIAKLTRAPGNDAAIGGLKVVTENEMKS